MDKYNKMHKYLNTTKTTIKNTKKCTKFCLTFDKAICVCQVSGMSLLITWILKWGCKIYFLSDQQGQKTKKN